MSSPTLATMSKETDNILVTTQIQTEDTAASSDASSPLLTDANRRHAGPQRCYLRSMASLKLALMRYRSDLLFMY